jgi:hypothetical protein
MRCAVLSRPFFRYLFATRRANRGPKKSSHPRALQQRLMGGRLSAARDERHPFGKGPGRPNPGAKAAVTLPDCVFQRPAATATARRRQAARPDHRARR